MPLPRAAVFLAGLIVHSAAFLPASAADRAVLSRAGEAIELRGSHARAIVFYERRSQAEGAKLDVTLLLGGDMLGMEVLRARMPLADGQAHAVAFGSGTPAGADTFRITRNGDRVTVDVRTGDSVASAIGAEAPATPEVSPAASGTSQFADASY